MGDGRKGQRRRRRLAERSEPYCRTKLTGHQRGRRHADEARPTAQRGGKDARCAAWRHEQYKHHTNKRRLWEGERGWEKGTRGVHVRGEGRSDGHASCAECHGWVEQGGAHTGRAQRVRVEQQARVKGRQMQ